MAARRWDRAACMLMCGLVSGWEKKRRPDHPRRAILYPAEPSTTARPMPAMPSGSTPVCRPGWGLDRAPHPPGGPGAGGLEVGPADVLCSPPPPPLLLPPCRAADQSSRGPQVAGIWAATRFVRGHCVCSQRNCHHVGAAAAGAANERWAGGRRRRACAARQKEGSRQATVWCMVAAQHGQRTSVLVAGSSGMSCNWAGPFTAPSSRFQRGCQCRAGCNAFCCSAPWALSSLAAMLMECQ